MTYRPTLVPAVVAVAAVALTTGCGNSLAKPATLKAASSPCQTTADALPVDRSASDNPPVTSDEGTGIHTLESHASGSVDDVLAQTPDVAVLKVVGRDLPVAVGDNRPPGALQTGATYPPTSDPVSPTPLIIRPIRFEVVRVLKGTLPSCLDLDVPGGKVGTHRTVDESMPLVIKTGDQLLAMLQTRMSGTTVAPFATSLLKTSTDGSVQLTFGSEPVVNVATWQLSPTALATPAIVEPGSCDAAGNCAPPAG